MAQPRYPNFPQEKGVQCCGLQCSIRQRETASPSQEYPVISCLSSDEVWYVLGADSCLHLQCSLHVLHTPDHRLPFRALFERARRSRREQRGGQAMAWRNGIKKLASVLASVGASQFRDCGLRLSLVGVAGEH